MSSKLSNNLSATIWPIFFTKNLLFWISTYPLSWIVEIIFAYVEGLPIPFFSSSLTSAASENLDGGFVYFCSKLIFSTVRESPSFSDGRISSSFEEVLRTFVKPSKTNSLPLATKICSSTNVFADVDKYSASGIWDATNLSQINL